MRWFQHLFESYSNHQDCEVSKEINKENNITKQSTLKVNHIWQDLKI